MEKKRRTLAERYRRLKRIIRFLSKRGTLFRKKPPERQPAVQTTSHKKKKQWRQWRKIRYLIRRGTLVRRKKPHEHLNYQDQPRSPQKKAREFSLYRTYRILRFLIHTNRLFASNKRVTPAPSPRRKRKTFRRIRYLLRRGTLFKVKPPVTRSSVIKYLKNIFGPVYIRICINSLLLFLLAYCIVFVYTNLATSLTALTYDINSVIYYFKIDFLIDAKEWKTDAIKTVYSSGPFFSLVLSVFTLIIFLNISEESWYFRLLLFWIFCHAMIHFFGEMLIGIMTTKGIGLSIAYLYVKEYAKMFIIIISSSILIIMGLVLTRIALFTGNVYFNMVTATNRSYFLQSQFLIPSVLGTGIVFLMKFPRISEFDVLVSLTILLLILPLFARGTRMKDLYFDPDEKDLSIRPWALIAAAIAIALFRAFFTSGVRIS